MILLIAILAGVIYLSLLWFFARSFLAAWIVLLSLNFLNFAFGMDSIVIRGIHIDQMDILYLCLVPAGLIRSRVVSLRLTWLSLLSFGYLLLFGLSLARGFAIYPMTDVGNEARGLMNVVLALAYFLTVPRDLSVVKKVIVAYIVYAAALCFIAALHYGGLPVGGSVGVSKDLAFSADPRALPAGAASSIELALIFVASWAVYRRRSRWLGIMAAVFFLFVIVLQHRTVWAMLVATLLASAFIDRGVLRYIMRIGAGALVLGALLLMSDSNLRSVLVDQLRNSATNSDTLDWRIETWERSVSYDQSLLSVFIGQPVGTGFLRIDTNAGTYIAYAPHDEFIDDYLRVGLAGMLLLMAFVVRPVYGFFRNPESGLLLYPTPASWILATIAAVVFCIPYSASFDGFALIAMANGFIDVETSPLAHFHYAPQDRVSRLQIE